MATGRFWHHPPAHPPGPSSPALPLQDPACANLADWYEAFATVQAQGPGPAADGGKKPKKAAVKTAKGAKGKGKAQQGGGTEGGGGGGSDAAAQQQRELAARFSQATAELQYVGLIKPAKRRRGDYVQRWGCGWVGVGAPLVPGGR